MAARRSSGLPACVVMEEPPPLHEPVLLLAFEGWNDACDAATSAAKLIVEQRRGRVFASIDPEEFYVFTRERPLITLNPDGGRRITWPTPQFYACPEGQGGRDLVVLLGSEPWLRWRTFASAVLAVVQRVGTFGAVAVGALGADVPHTRPARVSGGSVHPAFAQRLAELGVGGSAYEGPTGILSVLLSACAEAGLPTASLWGHVPHYLNASPNPRVALAILRKLAGLLDLSLELDALDEAARAFDATVEEAVSQNETVRDYVRKLEEHWHQEDADAPRFRPSRGDLPSGEAVVRELEEFLRQRRERDGERN